MKATALPLCLIVLLTGACTPELGQYVPRTRTYSESVTFPQDAESAVTGGLWTPTQTGNYLFSDQRARQIGDIVTIVVEEQADASRDAQTTLNRESGMSTAINGFLGLIKYLQPQLAGADLLGTNATADFSGAGRTTRSERLSARVPATVKRVMPNGNMFVEGYRLILVNREENRFYISGVVRPADISDENVVRSSRIAEAEIEFSGRGVISDKQGPGALIRAIDQYSPF